MIRRPPRSTLSSSSAASDVYKRQTQSTGQKKGAMGVDDCGEHSVGTEFVVLGMGCAVVGSVGSTLGLILQKLAQLQNHDAPQEEKYSTSGAIVWSPTWLLGLAMLILIPFPLDLIAFSLAPQSLVVPLTGVTLVLNQVIAPKVLKERIRLLDWVATGVIVVGIVLSTAFGSHCSRSYTLDQIKHLFEQTPFLVAEGVFVLTMVLSWWWITFGAQMCCTQESNDKSCSVVFGWCAGAVGGQQQIFLKATGELFESGFNGSSDWDRWEAWMFVLGCIVLAVGQIQLLNKGLELWTAIKYLPIYNVCLILCSTTYGSIFYEEYRDLNTVGMVMFPFGVVVVVIGALVLGSKDDQDLDSTKVAVPYLLRLEQITEWIVWPEPGTTKDTKEPNPTIGSPPTSTCILVQSSASGQGPTTTPSGIKLSSGSTDLEQTQVAGGLPIHGSLD
eukprot:TRINITY_DN24212_c0_g1_i1.p1 TRINITY_DN24212_c0_g1~~TRINITY_DN24212_c0_g1_i1.p1  ORF type:complete len:444 (-),score=92.50 TRINITY_DN24212_c0_g1_i1:63-1394(-)